MERVKDILDIMQGALDKTLDPDALFALDRGMTEIGRLRQVVQSQIRIHNRLKRRYAELAIKTAENMLKGANDGK